MCGVSEQLLHHISGSRVGMHVSNKIQEARQQYMGQAGSQIYVLHLA